MGYDAKYWKDYSEFITFVEEKTGFSPGRLISDYKIAIPRINELNELFKIDETPEEDPIDLNWEIYEIPVTRSQIQKILDSNNLQENLLFLNFIEEVEKIDVKIKKWLLNSKEIEWWKEPKFKPLPLMIKQEDLDIS